MVSDDSLNQRCFNAGDVYAVYVKCGVLSGNNFSFTDGSGKV